PPFRTTFVTRIKTSTGIRWFQLENVIINPGEPSMEIQTVGRDITPLREAEADRQRQANEMIALGDVDRAGYTFDPDAIYEEVLQHIRLAIPARASIIALVDPKTQALTAMKRDGESDFPEEPVPMDVIYAEPRYNRLARVFEDYKDYDFDTDLFETPTLYLPFIIGEKIPGFLAIQDSSITHTDPIRLNFLVQLVRHASTALKMVTDHRQIEYQIKQLELLHDLSRQLAITSEIVEQNSILTTCIFALLRMLNGTGAFYCEYNPRTKNTRLLCQYVPPESPDDIEAALDFSLLIKPDSRDATLIRRHDPTIAEPVYKLMTAMQVKSLMVLPGIYNDTLRGFFVICESGYDRYFLD
ncbi:MAG TPA: hypothetical protein VJZ27_08300, partial [Aggregatilineales bacterium]|nr:hypothetical protein [Aggregatilineales bacterium]